MAGSRETFRKDPALGLERGERREERNGSRWINVALKMGRWQPMAANTKREKEMAATLLSKRRKEEWNIQLLLLRTPTEALALRVNRVFSGHILIRLTLPGVKLVACLVPDGCFRCRLSSIVMVSVGGRENHELVVVA